MIQEAKITRRFHFDAAHRLPNYDGKCSNLHGHRWTLEVTLEARIDDSGFVMDFNELKKHVSHLITNLDHHYLNDVVKNPTAENLCIYIWDFLSVYLQPLICSIRLYETPDSWVDYDGGL